MDNMGWYLEELEYDEDNQYDIHDYDISAIPNDFNISTIVSFIEAGKIIIPAFQRNFVWDIKRASKLIESLIIGLPIPQVFLYEEDRNKFMVIDGQQRLMSIYYFSKGKFPREEKKGELRRIFNNENKIPDKYLQDKTFFTDFDLNLGNEGNSYLNKRNFFTLEEEHKDIFWYNRPIRSVTVRQNSPAEDNSAMFEIFNRLNTGGLNLKPQEIRTSLYHSNFYNMLYEINAYDQWRTVLGKKEIDVNMKDIEILVRAFAVTIDFDSYKAPMNRFLNKFSERAKRFDREDISYLGELFRSFLKSIEKLDVDTFIENGKFKITTFEAVFVAICKSAFRNRTPVKIVLTQGKVNALKNDKVFIDSSQYTTAGRKNVNTRIEIAEKHFMEQ